MERRDIVLLFHLGRAQGGCEGRHRRRLQHGRGHRNRIVGFFTGAGSWLVESGKAILNGLGEGISAAIGSVTGIVSGAVDKIRSFFPFSPAKEGPFSGHGYTTYSGKALMRDWARGIASGESLVQKTIKSAVGGAGAMFSAGVPMTAAPAAAAIGGDTYITVEGRQQDADQSIKSAVDVIVAAADRASFVKKGVVGHGPHIYEGGAGIG